jgi:hypothetical protein
MKTTIDLPEDVLRDLLTFTKAPTKKAAVLQAVNDYNLRKRMARLGRLAGSLSNFISQDELATLRATHL